MEKGQISVQTENIFPIIKKFLYSDHEIFLRELVSNAVDATTKVKALASKGVYKEELGDLTIDILLDEKKKTLTIRDRGLGLTGEEMKKYLNQVAFSSAQEFLDKYQSEENQIIGHFGLGFYSSFMVADKVTVKSLSYTGEQPMQWECKGDPSYSIKDIKKKTRGTDVVLHIGNDENKEFLEKGRIEELLLKYCKFLPIQIRFETKTESTWEGEGDDRKEIKTEVDNLINNTNPLWKKATKDLKDQDYLDFYKELYPYSQDPMFWIHLNIDFPFNLTGILYFPKVSQSIEVQKNKIHLYSNQVYVTDDVKNIVPEFLTLLHGIIDSPDIPLNISRSYLQADQNVKKITSYITKKVADKLADTFKKDREEYEKKWKDISVFVKYGMLTEDKFSEKAEKFALLKNLEGKHFTFDEYNQFVKENQTDKHGKVIYLYTNQEAEHDSYIKGAQAKGYDVLISDNVIDNHFMQQLETKLKDVTFVRVDSDIPSNLVQKDEEIESVLSETEQEKIVTLFKDTLGETEGQVEIKPLNPNDHPVMITRPEFMRRMKEMQQFQNMGGMDFPDSYNVIINSNHPLVADKLLKMRSKDKKASFAKYLYKLALLNQNLLKGNDMSEFIEESIQFLQN